MKKKFKLINYVRCLLTSKTLLEGTKLLKDLE